MIALAGDVLGLNPAGGAPKPVGKKAIAPQPPAMPIDQVTVSDQARKEIAPGVTETGKIPVAGKKEPDGVDRLLGLMSDLFGTTLYDKGGVGGWIREQRAKNPDGKIDFRDIGFRRALARDLYGEMATKWSDSEVKDHITDEAVDYFFGNQDGKIDSNDQMTTAQLIKRLEFTLPRFKAQIAAGGENAFTYLGSYLSSHEIIIVDYTRAAEYFKGVDFSALGRANDRIFNKCLDGVMETYKFLSVKGMISEDEFKAAAEAYGKFKKGEGDEKTLPPRFKELLFASYWGLFKAECGARGVKLPKDALQDKIKGPKLVMDLMQGAFQNFIEGHSDVNPENITHDLPDSLDETGIQKAKTARDNQVGARNAAKKTDEVPAPDGNVKVVQ